MDSYFLPMVKRPSRYLGCEPNSVRFPRTTETLRVGLAFPDLYEIGMSHLGMSILYHCLNRTARFSAERVFLPESDLQGILRDRDIPLTTLESRTPLSQLDILGFTLSYELTYTNVLAMLDLGKIPLRSEQRNRKHPLVLAGGPCAFNPEPISAFIDAFVIGEAEFLLPEICDLVSAWKAAGESRESLLSALDQTEGIYVPSRFTRRTDPGSNSWTVSPTGTRDRQVKKRTIQDLDASPYPENPVIPFARIVHDRIRVEAARGCPHGCRFCQASVLYRPYRERSPARIRDLALASLANTGYGDLSLLALSIGDHSGLIPLTCSLMEKIQPCRVALSLPSIRVGSLDLSVMEEILRVRKTGFTLAPEAATERLQNVINKRIDEEEIFRTTHFLASRGWRMLKLYFMIGLPSERDEDVEAIVHLSEAILKMGRKARSGSFQVKVNISTFVPKAHTPFQWEAQLSRDEAYRKQAFLKKRLRKPGFQLNWHDAKLSLLEGVFARGDRSLCDLLEAAYRQGCTQDGWTEHLRFDRWEEAFSSVSVAPEALLHPYPDPQSPLPWQWIDTGVHTDFLLRERRRSLQAEETPFRCRGDCAKCGLCGPRSDSADTTGNALSVPREITSIKGPPSLRLPYAVPRQEPTQRIRVIYRKTGRCIHLSHLETINLFYRALRRSGLPFCFTEGEHPQPRVSFSPALPVGVESHSEHLDLWNQDPVDRDRAVERLNRVLPEGIFVLSAREVPLGAPSVEESILWVEYEILFQDTRGNGPSEPTVAQAVEAFRSGTPRPQETCPDADPPLKPPLSSAVQLDFLEEGLGLRCRVHKVAGSLASPLRILSELFPGCDPRELGTHIRKTQTAFLAFLPAAALVGRKAAHRTPGVRRKR
jgi:radical SAM family uncharacterized protein